MVALQLNILSWPWNFQMSQFTFLRLLSPISKIFWGYIMLVCDYNSELICASVYLWWGCLCIDNTQITKTPADFSSWYFPADICRVNVFHNPCKISGFGLTLTWCNKTMKYHISLWLKQKKSFTFLKTDQQESSSSCSSKAEPIGWKVEDLNLPLQKEGPLVRRWVQPSSYLGAMISTILSSAITNIQENSCPGLFFLNSCPWDRQRRQTKELAHLVTLTF